MPSGPDHRAPPPQAPRQGPGERCDLEALRERIRLLERGPGSCGGPGGGQTLPLGLPELEAVLPPGGLPLAVLHEIAPGRQDWDDGPVTGFCLALLIRIAARLPGPVLWLTRGGDLYAPGLAAFGFDPARLIEARAGGDTEALWGLEEGLRSGALAAVVGEVAELDATAARRLQLAAESGGVTGFLLRRWRRPQGAEAPLAAAARWRVSAAPAESHAFSAGGIALPRPRWRVELRRCRGGRPRDFHMEWDHATGDFGLVAALCDGTADGGGAPAEARRAG